MCPFRIELPAEIDFIDSEESLHMEKERNKLFYSLNIYSYTENSERKRATGFLMRFINITSWRSGTLYQKRAEVISGSFVFQFTFPEVMCGICDWVMLDGGANNNVEQLRARITIAFVLFGMLFYFSHPTPYKNTYIYKYV